MQPHLEMWIDFHQTIARRFRFRPADVFRPVKELAMQIGKRHPIVIHNPDGPDTGRCEIERRGRTESARPETQNTRAAFSFSCPASPISGSMMCRE